MFVTQIPEMMLFRINVIVVEDSPRKSDQFILSQRSFHRALRTFAPCIIEWGNPELQHQFSRFARFEVVFDCMVRVRQFLCILSASPIHRPVFSLRGREDVVVLRLVALIGEVSIGATDAGIDIGRLADSFFRPHVAVIDIDQRSTRQIAIHDNFEDVVVQVRS